MKNYQAILMIIIGFGLGIGTISGVVQNYIGFAGVDNEMAFSFMGIFMGTLGIFAVDYKKLLIGLK
jgi:hypothetical protein